MRTLQTSVRRLVEFLLRSGDIDSNNVLHAGVEAMQAGSNIHRMLQASGGKAYQAEVSLACSIFFPGDVFDPHAARLPIREESVSDQKGFFLTVEGRADGIIDDGTHPVTIDEIKGVSRDVSTIEEPDALHEAQALCYAYLYLRSTRGASTLPYAFGEQVVIRITYASMDTGEVRQIERTHSAPDIEAWFFSLLDAAQRWAAWRVRHDELRQTSLASLTFPFAPRGDQRTIMNAVSTAIRNEGRLYVQAPTGSGKTIATLYPALKALAANKASRVAFLTAKTTTRGAVLECLDLLRQQSFSANVLVVTARNKICPLHRNAHDEQVRTRPLASLCNPVECPFARGHYDMANDALFDAITTQNVIDFEHIQRVATRHHVCPYELQRDATRWADIIVCDYHYAFAPSAGLFGLADEPGDEGTIFLVDEAHNLVERMRDTYSAELGVGELTELGRLLRTRGTLSELLKAVHATIAAFPTWEQALPAAARQDAKSQRRRANHHVVHISEELVDLLTSLSDGIGDALEQLLDSLGDHPANKSRTTISGGSAIEVFLALRDIDYRIRSFLGTLQRAEAGYVTFLGHAQNGGRTLKIYCVDPSHDLSERLEQAKAAIFFSGTLLPMDYHRRLLAAQDEDPSVFAHPSFDPQRLQVLVASDVNARFLARGPLLYARIAAYLAALLRKRPGNYLVFFPSYAMMEEVERTFVPLANKRVEVVRQSPGMREDERERFVDRFKQTRTAGTSLIGLCVLGGIFGESIDLPGEALVGVVVVGTGMPVATAEREVIRNYFDAREGNGFAYAYTYPGMIKVLQAAGRLIRTETDRGVVLLLDERFLEEGLQEVFPLEWKDVRSCTLETLPGFLARP